MGVLLLIGAWSCTLGEHARAMDGASFPWKPGVIVDPSRGVAYITAAGRGVAAISLSSGAEVWHSTAAEKPLARCRNLLLAKATSPGALATLRIRALNVGDPAEVVFTTDVNLPEGVVPNLLDGAGTRFRCRARCKDGRALVDWTFSRQSMEGMDTSGAELSVRRAGVIELALGDGRLIRAAEEAPSGVPEPDIPDAIAAQIEERKLSGSILVGERIVSVVERGTEQEGVMLHRWRASSAEPLPSLRLFAGGPTYRYPSADGRHLLASEVAADQPSGAYLWHVFSVATGEEAIALPKDRAGASFFVWGSLLIHDEPATRGGSADDPPRMLAVDLSSGAVVWSRPILDPSFQGKLAPGELAPMLSSDPD